MIRNPSRVQHERSAFHAECNFGICGEAHGYRNISAMFPKEQITCKRQDKREKWLGQEEVELHIGNQTKESLNYRLYEREVSEWILKAC